MVYKSTLLKHNLTLFLFTCSSLCFEFGSGGQISPPAIGNSKEHLCNVSVRGTKPFDAGDLQVVFTISHLAVVFLLP
mgnify:CR=1 FL=1